MMRVLICLVLTMMAFGANSVLNRLALAETTISAVDFALFRVGFGAVTLFTLIALRGELAQGRFSWPSTLGLTAYMLGFSLAYQSIGAGLGALLLFGVVQLTMFSGALLGGERPKFATYAGAALGLLGLFVVLWPASGELEFTTGAAASMIVAGIGWGIFSLAGRGAAAPLATTFRAFLLTLPAVFAVAVWQGIGPVDPWGLAYAAISGVVMSGLGYALWYAVLPRIAATSAALAQLTVPLIAMAGGLIFLEEMVDDRFVIGSAMVLSGVILPIWFAQRQDGK
ncbi:MAG: DMT family transporter [Pseudomonadota bacterium]